MLLTTIDPATFKTKGNVGAWALWLCEKTGGPGPYKTVGLSGRLQACSAFDSLTGVPQNADECCIETPRYYKDSPTPPQDLIDLAFDTGLTARHAGQTFTAVDPNTWKGNVPKDVTERRVLQRLDAKEREALNNALRDLRKSWHHNVFDAVALGLWRLGRMPR